MGEWSAKNGTAGGCANNKETYHNNPRYQVQTLFGIFKGLFINYITHLRGRGSVTPGLRAYRCYEGGEKCYARAKLLRGELYARTKGIEVLWRRERSVMLRLSCYVGGRASKITDNCVMWKH